MSKVYALYHVVFATNSRRRTIAYDKRRELYAYLYGILKSENCWVDRINGMSDHVHLLFDLNPQISLSYMIQKLKQSSSKWLKSNKNFPDFNGWGKGYYACAIGIERREDVRLYILNQEKHHVDCEFFDEVRGIAQKYNFQWFEDDWN